MRRRLLVHVDSTDSSREVAKHAIDMAAKTRAEVRFVYRETGRAARQTGPAFAGSPDEWLDAARERGHATLRGALTASLGAGVMCDGIYAEGEHADGLADIERAALSWRADIVVMGDTDAAYHAPSSARRTRLTHVFSRPLTVLLVHLAEVGVGQRADRNPQVCVRFVDFGDLDGASLLSA